MAIFSIEEIYTSWASYKGLPFPINSQLFPRKQDIGSKTEEEPTTQLVELTDEKSFTNLYGQPVIIPATLGGVDLGNGDSVHINLQPMVVVEASKQIVKTPIVGGTYPGSVKEFINFDDYRIRIFGAVVSRNQNVYPRQQVDILKSLWKKNEALKFDCIITEDMFTHVVIESFKLDELRMAPGIQFYEFNCVSDGVQEVEYLKNDNADS